MNSGRFKALPTSPFARLRDLLQPHAAGKPPLSLALGEPRHKPPDWIGDVMGATPEDYGRYPPVQGLTELREAARDWCVRRFALPTGWLDAEQMVLPLNGTREGLFMAAQLATAKPEAQILMPNPSYPAYAAAALAAGAQPHYLPTSAATHFLPDLDAISTETLAACSAFYLCSPANPQGAVAPRAYLAKLLELARQHDFIILADECYSDIYDAAPPPSLMEVAGDDAPFLVFHSLSKRANLPGLRAGFCVGGRALMARFAALRQIAAPQTPLPAQRAAVRAWGDDAYIAENRAAYRAKLDIAEAIFGADFGFYRPQGGFFLWLNVAELATKSDDDAGEQAALRLWREEGLRVLPGLYLGQDTQNGNPGAHYIRVALVEAVDIMPDALTRLVGCLTQARAAA